MGDGCRIAYRFDGRDDLPVLVLSNSLGTNMDMWAPQVETLVPHYRLLRYDTRGHGRSDAPPGAYSLERLGFDVLELLDQLGLQRVRFCGLSLGGMIGQWLGVRAPERIERLVLANTAASMGPREDWQQRIDLVLRDGLGAVADASLARWLTPAFRAHAPAVLDALRETLLDAAGRRASLPLAELLGGRVHDRLEVAWTLASGDTQKDIEEAEQMLDRRRHRIFKLKIGSRSVDEDVRHVAAIKRARGDRASVRVDVNQAWDESMAMRGIAALEVAGVDLVEQPVARAHVRAMQRLAARFIIPVMADESLHGPESALEIAREAAADVFAVKISPSGGLRAAARVAAIAEAAGIGLYGGTMLESGVGTAAAAQLCATFHTIAWGTELFGPLLLTEEILRDPLVYRDFSLVVPAGPGLGVELDDDRIEVFRRDRGSRRAYSTLTSGGA